MAEGAGEAHESERRERVIPSKAHQIEATQGGVRSLFFCYFRTYIYIKEKKKSCVSLCVFLCVCVCTYCLVHGRNNGVGGTRGWRRVCVCGKPCGRVYSCCLSPREGAYVQNLGVSREAHRVFCEHFLFCFCCFVLLYFSHPCPPQRVPAFPFVFRGWCCFILAALPLCFGKCATNHVVFFRGGGRGGGGSGRDVEGGCCDGNCVFERR